MRARNAIGGELTMEALSRLHFHTLAPEERAAAIHRLSRAGYSDHGIAAATGLSVEAVRAALSELKYTHTG
jgi:DNA-binding NarL/FixJ family response regulator